MQTFRFKGSGIEIIEDHPDQTTADERAKDLTKQFRTKIEAKKHKQKPEKRAS